MKEEKLPENWYLRVTDESLEYVNEYRAIFNKHHLVPGEYDAIIKDGRARGWDFCFVEISLDTFKRLVLKKKSTDDSWIPQVDEWVTIEDSNKLQDGCLGCPTGTFQVIQIEENHKGLLDIYEDTFSVKTNQGNWTISTKGVRKALPHEIPHVPVEKTFEVGKWYRHFSYENTCAKFLKFENSKWIGSEWITDTGAYKYEKFTSSIHNKSYKIDLSEIQQYLPDGHVDKIKKEKDMFNKGDYIVLTEADFGMSSFSIGHCYKQKENSKYLRSERDDNGSTTNGYDACEYNNKGRIKWRYATKEEIAEYDRLDKPFDIRTLEMKRSWLDTAMVEFQGFANKMSEGITGRDDWIYSTDLIKVTDLSDSKVIKSPKPVLMSNHKNKETSKQLIIIKNKNK